MAKIDRSGHEKVINIGPWKIKMSTFCALGLVIIMVGSSLGYIANEIGKKQEPQNKQNQNLIEVRVAVLFGENETPVEQIVNVGPGAKVGDVLKKTANITVTQVPNGQKLFSVTYGDKDYHNTDTHEWAIYLNGRLSIGGIIDREGINSGDIVQAKYEKKLF